MEIYLEMDDPDEENIESSWIMINSVDMAEEATILDSGGFLDESQTKKNHDGIESDLESHEPVQELSDELGSIQSDLDSDGISIISDCDSLNEYLDDDNKLVEGAVVNENHNNENTELASNSLLKIEKRIKRKKENALKEEEITKIKKYLIVKEQYLEEKEKFLIKREYELIKAEMNFKTNVLDNLEPVLKEKKKP
ncbi:hypothetical protein NQ318_013562 [Aromia moschata]|uniref:Uncharacterized protein n=1 Tax=Aromia moschata TaxID=1265417 RepID=A0AAV8XYG0_9CUCU|nr:hypothetical protein NQ318_013562 [Aromia moschata]